MRARPGLREDSVSRGLGAWWLMVATGVYAVLVGAGRLPRYDGLLYFALCAWAAHVKVRSSAWRTALFVAFLVTVTMGGLLNMWWSYGGVVDRQALLGDLIPWSDAGGYLSDATRRSYGLPLGEGARRPLYLVVLSALLRLTGSNVRAVVALLALTCSGLAAMVSARIADRARPWGTALALVIVYSFVRRHAFALSTESLGFVFGSAAFLVLFRKSLSNGDLLAGTVLFALGLATRMGPVLVVAATVVFFVVRRQWLRAVVVASGWTLVLAGDAWLLACIRGPGVAMGDYGPILYGMLHGEDFTFISAVHPELSMLPAAHRGSAILAIVLSELRRQPTLAVVGPIRSLASFLFMPHGLLSFVLYNPDDIFLESGRTLRGLVATMVGGVGIYRTLSYGAMLLMACAATIVFLIALGKFLWHRPADPTLQFCGYVFVGVVLSSAFTPPWITEGEQLQSSTLPFLAAFAGSSFGAAVRRPSVSFSSSSPASTFSASAWAALAAVGVVVACAFLPARLAQTIPACFSGGTSSVLLARGMPGTRVEVSDSNRGYSMDRVRTNARYLARHHGDLATPLLELASPHMAFEVAFDGCMEGTRVVAAARDLLARWGDHWATLEVEPHEGMWLVVRIRDLR